MRPKANLEDGMDPIGANITSLGPIANSEIGKTFKLLFPPLRSGHLVKQIRCIFANSPFKDTKNYKSDVLTVFCCLSNV